MDTQTLIESLRNVTVSEYEWTLCMYTAKKSKDGVELEISRCPMQDIAGFVESTVVGLLEKTLTTRSVADYTPFLDKEVIGALEQSDELIHEPIQEILSAVDTAYPFGAEDYVDGAAATPTGYLFLGCKADEQGAVVDRIMLMKRGNPFMKSAKARLCVSQNGEIVTSETPILKFAQSVDFLLVGGYGYLFASSIEKDLGLEARPVAITAKRLDVIAQSAVVNNFEELEKAAYKNTRKFLDFDREVLEYIVKLPVLERMDFLGDYGLTTDNNGLIDTGDAEQCVLLIDLLCGRSCHDALGRLSVGSHIMPRL
jgi:hypothetical protein